ncbi:MAG: NMT1/THI5 like protein [bacterium ADurb.Bin429]|nr:MAG: NMT1/THI5 like protein [bacterium ADurb.Bin429]
MQRLTWHRIIILLTMALCQFAVLPASAQGQSRPITLMMQWTPQAQFAGYYVALDKGFYRQRGLDVRIEHGGPDKNPLADLRDGRVTFTTMFLSSALVARGQGAPLINCAQIVNQSTLMVVAWRDRGITRLEHLNRRPVSIWGGDFRAPFIGLFNSKKISPHIYTQNYSVNLFLHHGVDACSAMYYNEYHMLYQAGVNPDEITAFFLRDYGCGIPEDGIYGLEQTYRDNPQMCTAIGEASLEGWRYANTHQQEALDIVMKYARRAHVPTNRAHQTWMLRTILPAILPANTSSWSPGILSRGDFQRAVSLVASQLQVRRVPDYPAFCKGVSHAP